MARFKWDPAKAARNVRKHSVTFAEATKVFADPLAMTMPDTKHSVGEERLVTQGIGARGRLLVVSHVDDGDTIRIISARIAAPRERRSYEY